MIYLPALDGLRGYAVLLVLAQHWLGNDHFLNKFNNGLIGVTLFYVLSGFLITGILLKNKHDVSATGIVVQLRNFWIRRILRIFPVYYGILLLLFLVGFQDIRQQFFYFVTYTQNILFFTSADNFGYLIHFWSLAIEEQFYLIWPILILLVRSDRILLFIVLTIGGGLFFRFAVHNGIFHLDINPVNYHLAGSMDLFGYGAFLAHVTSKKEVAEKKVLLFLGIILILLLGLKFFCAYLDYLTFIGLLSMSLIFLVLQYSNLVIKWVFCNPLIMRFGRISYGVYLVHYFMYPLNHWLHELCVQHKLKLPIVDIIVFPEFSNIYIRFIYFLILTTLLAFISWHSIEKPFLKLKAKFNYAPQK